MSSAVVTKRPMVRRLKPLLVDAGAAAALLGIGKSQFWKMNAGGETPAAILLADRCTRWRVRELVAWTDAGCPPRGSPLSIPDNRWPMPLASCCSTCGSGGWQHDRPPHLRTLGNDKTRRRAMRGVWEIRNLHRLARLKD